MFNTHMLNVGKYTIHGASGIAMLNCRMVYPRNTSFSILGGFMLDRWTIGPGRSVFSPGLDRSHHPRQCEYVDVLEIGVGG